MAAISEDRAPDIQLEELVADCLDNFFRRKLEILHTFDLKESLLNQNPYFFKVYGIYKASEIVERVLTDFISASDENDIRRCFL